MEGIPLLSNVDPKQHSKVLTGFGLTAGLAFLFVFGCTMSPLRAQTRYIPTAPKPSQLIAAKTVFLSNDTVAPLADSDKIFDEIYRSVQQLNRFTIVSNPSDADLILQFGLQNIDTTQIISLRIIDPKTNTILWSVGDAGQTKAIYGSNGKKNQHDVVDNIIDYLQAVTTSTSPKSN